MGTGLEILAIGGLAAGLAGAGASAFGAIQQGQAQKAQANYQAKVAQNNAAIAREKARIAAASGEQQATAQGLKSRQIEAAIQSGQAASGIDISSGSALDVQQSAHELGQLDALTLRSNTARAVQGYEQEGQNFDTSGQLTRYAGENAATAGWLSGAGSLLSGAASAADKWSTYQQKGLFSSPVATGGGGSSFNVPAMA